MVAFTVDDDAQEVYVLAVTYGGGVHPIFGQPAAQPALQSGDPAQRLFSMENLMASKALIPHSTEGISPYSSQNGTPVRSPTQSCPLLPSDPVVTAALRRAPTGN